MLNSKRGGERTGGEKCERGLEGEEDEAEEDEEAEEGYDTLRAERVSEKFERRLRPSSSSSETVMGLRRELLFEERDIPEVSKRNLSETLAVFPFN